MNGQPKAPPAGRAPGRDPGAPPGAEGIPALRARGLAVELDGRRVLDGVDLDLGPGWTALVGPNGAGKSTLLRALAGLLRPAAGRVELDGQDLRRLPPATRARGLAWLAQQAEPSGELTVRETVELGRLARLGLHGQPGPADQAAVDQALAETGCSGWAARHLTALSGGERQRVMLARVLATGAPWLLLDEPGTHLDAPQQLALARLLRRLGQGPGPARAVLSVVHEPALAVQADRLLVLAGGRLRAAGSPADPAVQAVLAEVFEGALRFEPGGPQGRPRVRLAFED